MAIICSCRVTMRPKPLGEMMPERIDNLPRHSRLSCVSENADLTSPFIEMPQS